MCSMFHYITRGKLVTALDCMCKRIQQTSNKGLEVAWNIKNTVDFRSQLSDVAKAIQYLNEQHQAQSTKQEAARQLATYRGNGYKAGKLNMDIETQKQC